MPGRCNKMIDYVNKENMESVRGIENPGMMGEMGKIIGFYRLYRQTAEEGWEEKAEVLLDEVMENCSLELPVTYGDGLCGVGVGIEYLLQEGFVEGDRRKGAVISVDIDKLQAIEELKKDLQVVLAKSRCKKVSKQEVHALIDEIYQNYEDNGGIE